jgi:hypothetical protein
MVGFVITEGSFLKKNNGDICFQISQRKDLELFEAIKYKFKTKRK